MKDKFELTYLKSGEVKCFKSLKEISKELNIEYHQVRSILNSSNKKFLHPLIKNYTDNYKITYCTNLFRFDNPFINC